MTSLPADSGIAQQAELQALRTMLTFSRGTFSLSFAVCNSPALRDFLIDSLRRDCPGLHVQTISPGCTDILAEAITPVDPDDLPGLFLAGLESCVPSSQTDHPVLRALNASREAWAQKFRCPVVFWVPEYVMRILYRQARDLMAWRSHQFEFGPEPADLDRAGSLSVMDYSLAANLSLEEKRFRIAELEGRIAQAGPDIPETLVPYVARWMIELATLREVLGDPAAAMEELDKAVDLLAKPSSKGAMGDDGRDRLRAMTMGQISDILQARGELDEALRIRREEVLPAYERLGDVRSRAVTMSKIADILQQRGQTDEALRIQREEELPVYERLGDVRERAVTMGKIADILQARGELDEALRILREETLPAFERLGDVRDRAVTMGQIADILQQRGQTDEALRIRREEELPVYERLGDVRSRAVTMGKIADILRARGELDEALRIWRKEVLPAFERLGAVRERALTMGRIAGILQQRGQTDEALRIRREEELPVYERLGDVRERAVTMRKIAGILEARGELDEALRIRREEELPVYERLGDVRNLLVGRTNLALTLLERGRPEDRAEARGLLELALAAARELGIPEQERIQRMLDGLG